MPTLDPEQNPANLQPEQAEGSIIQAIEDSYWALYRRAYSDLLTPARTLEIQALPFAKGLNKMTYWLYKSWLSNEADDTEDFMVNNLRRDTLQAILRVNVFSGNTFNLPLIGMTMDHVQDTDREWLEKTLRPTPTLFDEHRIRYSNKRVMRKRGHDAMRSLGILPVYTGWLVRAIDSAR